MNYMRLSFSESGSESSCLESKNLENQKRCFNELESSNSSSGEEDCSIGRKLLKCDNLGFSGEKHLRSPSLKSVADDDASEYMEKVIAKMSREKDMESRFSSVLPTDESFRLDAFDNLSDSSDECPSKSTWSSNRKFDPVLFDDQAEYDSSNLLEPPEKRTTKKFESRKSSKNKKKNSNTCFFIGDPIPDNEAQERWHWRYELKVLT